MHNSYIRSMVAASALSYAKNIVLQMMAANVSKAEAKAEAIKGLRDAADELEKSK